MKTKVSKHSVAVYHTIYDLMSEQQARIYSTMEPGQLYSRRLLGKLTGIEPGSVCRAVWDLIASNFIEETCTISCPLTGRRVGGLARVVRSW